MTQRARWLIWSMRHRQWWRADRGGYTMDTSNAGLYTLVDVAEIVTQGLPGQQVPVGVELADQFADLEADKVVELIDSFRRY